MSSIPEDLYLDILLNLPVKSLLTCKCVCKSWFELISAPSFVESHLNLSKNKDPSLILNSCKTKGYVISSMTYHSLISSSPSNDLNKTCVEFDYYPFNSKRYVRLVGSCNGLVCLSVVEDKTFFCLWNPATNEYRNIHSPLVIRSSVIDSVIDSSTTSFGYDYIADDYMLVNIEYCRYGIFSMRVYTLKPKFWQTIIGAHRYKVYGKYGVFANGSFHLLVANRGQNFSKALISLDIRNKSFIELQLPKEALENKGLSFMNPAVLEGCLSLLVNISGSCLEVWVMGSYGVQESWTKRYVITDSRIAKHLCLRLICSFKNGEILLRMGKFLVLYDTKHAISGQTKRPRNMSGIENYVESLVSPNSRH